MPSSCRRYPDASLILVAFVAATSLAACGFEQITQGGSGKQATDAGSSDAAVEAGITGQGCGVESDTGATLCRVTSQCPSAVVDSQALPHCGYRIKGGSSELVCACGESICSMGAFTTCAQAAQLLASQTESSVCVQVAEGRCATGTPGSSSASSGSSGSTCDRKCLSECGGGAGCASICGC